MKQEYCIFRKADGSFVFTSSAEPKGYIDNIEYEVVISTPLDPSYQYSLVNGVIVKGDPYPEIVE